MTSACITLKANTHLANSKKGDLFGHYDNGFLGERLKGSLNNNPWLINQSTTRLRTHKSDKEIKPGVLVSAVLTPNNAKESLVIKPNLIILWF